MAPRPFLRPAVISIHALREEGDGHNSKNCENPKPFLSTPSARRATLLHLIKQRSRPLFLSTPSARRATGGWPDGL